MISYPRVIKSPIVNYCIKVNLYERIELANTELHQKVLPEVSVYGLHMHMQNTILLVFPWNMMKNHLSILLILIFDCFFRHTYKR